MADIEVSIIDGVANITQEGFGIPTVFGETDQYRVVKIGSGKSQLIFRSTSRDTAASIVIVQTGAVIDFSASGSVVTLTIPTTGATAKQVKDNYDDNTYTSVKALVVLTLANSGSGAVATFSETALETVTEFVLERKSDVDNLLPYYATSDVEYKMATAFFTQELKPEKVYIFNASSESSNSDDFTEIIEAFENQDYYFLLLTNTHKIRAVEAATYGDLNGKLVFLLTEDSTLLDDLALVGSSAVVLCTDDTNRVDAMIVGLQAPKIPGSTTWKWKKANGAVAETDSTLIDAARSGNGNVFISTSGVTFFVEGKMTNGLFIDQKHQRDYMRARIAEDFLALFTTEEKITYDDPGIAQLVTRLSNKLSSFGDGGIIARASSEDEVRLSFDKRYQYSIDAPTRAEMLASDPQAVVDRQYALTFNFVEAGAIHDLVVTGKVMLQLT